MKTDNPEERCPASQAMAGLAVHRLLRGEVSARRFLREAAHLGIINADEEQTAMPIVRMCAVIELPGNRWVLITDTGEVL